MCVTDMYVVGVRVAVEDVYQQTHLWSKGVRRSEGGGCTWSWITGKQAML